MQDIVKRRKNKVLIPQRVKFAIYKKRHLESLIRKINNHIDELYKIYTPFASEQDGLGKAELAELF